MKVTLFESGSCCTKPNEEIIMLLDGLYVTHQPLPGWDYTKAAARLFGANGSFLKSCPGAYHPNGDWELTLFPFPMYVNRVLTEGQVAYMREKVRGFLEYRHPKGRYETIKGLATMLKSELEYAPYPLSLGSPSHRSWAWKMFDRKLCYNNK